MGTKIDFCTLTINIRIQIKNTFLKHYKQYYFKHWLGTNSCSVQKEISASTLVVSSSGNQPAGTKRLLCAKNHHWNPSCSFWSRSYHLIIMSDHHLALLGAEPVALAIKISAKATFLIFILLHSFEDTSLTN